MEDTFFEPETNHTSRNWRTQKTTDSLPKNN